MFLADTFRNQVKLIYFSLVLLLTRFPSQEVDAVTAGCLALREQVAIYEEQLANMEAQHKTVRGRGKIYSCSVMKQEEFNAMKMTQNVALRSDRSVGQMPRPAVTNTAVMTPVTLLRSQKQPCTEKYGERIKAQKYVIQ